MAAAGAGADPGALVPGQRVIFVGLVGRADLNGTIGTLAHWNDSSGRWAAALGDGGSVNVRPCNLQAAAPAPPPAKAARTAARGKGRGRGRRTAAARASAGAAAAAVEDECPLEAGQRVVLTGLAGRQELNGSFGTLVSWRAADGRWAVELTRGGCTVNVLPANLEAAPAAARPGSAASTSSNIQAVKKLLKFSKTGKRKVPPKATASKTSKGKPPQKPKKPLSAYMIFCSKNREDIMRVLRLKYGSVDLGLLSATLSERWANVDKKEKTKYQRLAAKRKQTWNDKMQAYREAVDPVGFLRNKYGDRIPKRPPSAYQLFCADERQRKKAAESIRVAKEKGSEGVEDVNLWSMLGEMWRTLPPKEKEPYESQHGRDVAEFERKNDAWRKTREFARLQEAEQEVNEKRASEKRALKEAEEEEIRSLLASGVTEGKGLAPQRRAVITGLVGRQELNGQQVVLHALIVETGRWKVSSEEINGGASMNIRPQNLTWLRLQSESEKRDKLERQERQRAAERQAKEEERAAQRQARAVEQDAAKRERQAELQAAREEEKAALVDFKREQRAAQAAQKEQRKDAERAIKAARTAEELEAARAKLQQLLLGVGATCPASPAEAELLD